MNDSSEPARYSRTDLCVGLGVVVLAVGLFLPWAAASRDAARRSRCTDNMRQLGVALQSYTSSFGRLPYAARWEAGDLPFDYMDVEPGAIRVTYENWVQLLLPLLGRQDLSDAFDPSVPVVDPQNADARTAELEAFRCPADAYARPDNPYAYADPGRAKTPAMFARGDYAINGGSQVVGRYPGRSSAPSAEGAWYVHDPASKTFQWWGNGVAGVNKSFSLDEFANGLSTLAAVDEVRAGVHAVDPRGVWALGQIGGSITFAHGDTGDDPGPNNLGDKADDIIGCDRLQELVGEEALARERMPCCSYRRANEQATARSLHAGGVNVLMMDGAVRFVPDAIDPGLWHVMHSRETPPGVVDPDRIEEARRVDDAEAVAGLAAAPDGPSRIVDAIGMELVLVPPGEFTMGLPDAGFEEDVPPECPPHRVRITRPFYLGVHEVTQGQYERVMGRNPSWHASASGLRGQPKQDTDLLPVEQVSWEDAVAFCRRLSQLSSAAGEGLAYRLPTEAEWEYACRSGRSVPYQWPPQADPRTGENAGEQQIGWLDVATVGSYPPNGFGLFDMRGNVYEWCADWFARDYYARSPVDDPQGPASGHLRVVRGGDWLFVGEGCMINRRITPPWKSSAYLGFRVAAAPVAGPEGQGRLQAVAREPAPSLRIAVYSSHRNPRKMELIKLDPISRKASLLKADWSVSPAWSPDGRRIAFAESKADIWVMDADGLEQRNLTAGAFKFAKAPSWSPDGRRIVFFATRDDAAWSLYIVDADGGGLHALAEDVGNLPMPAWSPDGRRILFVTDREGEPGTLDLATTDPEGGSKRTIRGNVPFLCAPAWSPDGERFAFADSGPTPGSLQLVVAQADGTVIERIEPNAEGRDVFPAWSPDGRLIAYVHFSGRDEDRGDLMVYDLDRKTHAAVSLGTLIYGEDVRPSWERPADYEGAATSARDVH